MSVELDVLMQQLDELLTEPAVDAEDALEIACVAGLAARLDAPATALADAVGFRDGVGKELLEQAFAELDVEDLLGELDGVLSDATPEQVEDALSDIDDVIAAAIWCGQRKAVKELAKRTAKTVRDVPEAFAAMAPDGVELAKKAAIARDFDLYDYWLAVADAKAWSE